MKNVYYIVFNNGGFELLMADRMEQTQMDYVFWENKPGKGEVIAAKWPKSDVKSVTVNPTFETQ